MARCESNDGKFAGLDEPTVEVESEDVTGGELQATVRVVRPCSGCGQDQATLTLEFAIAFEHECPDEIEGGESFDPETELNGETIADRTYSGSVEADPSTNTRPSTAGARRSVTRDISGTCWGRRSRPLLRARGAASRSTYPRRRPKLRVRLKMRAHTDP